MKAKKFKGKNLRSSVKAPAVIKGVTYSKVVWRKLNIEPVTPGDIWVSSGANPNSPERQGEDHYNLQMQAIDPGDWGVPANKISRNSGDYWRPTTVIELSIVF